MVVCIDLRLPLISNIKTKNEIQCVEYECLPSICFTCGKYDYISKGCSLTHSLIVEEEDVAPKPPFMARIQHQVECENFSFRMVVE